MKERSIILSGPMVLAAMDGRKTQMRVEVNPQPNASGMKMLHNYDPSHLYHAMQNDGERFFACPLGNVGDRLWVRESFYIDTWSSPSQGRLPATMPPMDMHDVYYPADARGVEKWCCELIPECSCAEVGKPKIRPSSQMPRWASRLTLEITGVKVERLNDISEEDVRAEGVDSWDVRRSFMRSWQATHGPGSWAANPWLWAITFKAHQDPESA